MANWKAWKPRLRKLPRALMRDPSWSEPGSRWIGVFTLSLAGLVAGALQGKVLHAWSYGDQDFYGGDAFVWDAIEYFAWIGLAIGLSAGISLALSRHLFVRGSLAALLGSLSVALSIWLYSEGRRNYLWGAHEESESSWISTAAGWGVGLGGPAAFILAGMSHLVRRCSGKVRLLVLVLLATTVFSVRCQDFFWSAWNGIGWGIPVPIGCCVHSYGYRDMPSTAGSLLLTSTSFLACLLIELAGAACRRWGNPRWLAIASCSLLMLSLGGLVWASEDLAWTPRSRLSRMAFTSDPHLLATVHEGEALRLWKVNATTSGRSPSVREVRRLRLNRGPIRFHSFALSSTLAAAAGEDGRIALWRLPSLEPLPEISGSGRPVRALTLSPNGKMIAAHDPDGRILLWERVTNETVTTITRKLRPIEIAKDRRLSYLAFSPDGKIIAIPESSGSGRATLRLYDLRTASPLPYLGEHAHYRFSPIIFSSDGGYFLCRCDPGMAAILDLHNGGKKYFRTDLRPLDFSPDARRLAVGSSEVVAILDVETGRTLKTIASAGYRDLVKFSPDGRWLIRADDYGDIEAIDLKIR